MRFVTILAASAATMTCAGAASAATTTAFAQYGQLNGAPSWVIDSKFDTSLGTLNSVNILFNIENQQYYDVFSYRNNVEAPSTITLPTTALATIKFLRPEAFKFVLNLVTPARYTLSGRQEVFARSTGQFQVDILNDFTGFLRDGSPSMMTVSTVPIGVASVVGPGYVQAVDSGNFVTASVTYNYTAFAVPEPATWAMMILGMGAVGTSLRRRKRAMPLVA